ncbi:DNA alkylation repair protein [Paeniglutamicibacter sp. ABSL32-1]|uniref:DNA alkylation repair protein n=1 Tax=Paeniglutamicibacter quisquiliarum TaxID=2849498 RepID=UPI001C2D02AC|nr:DNA alkylation repair protein [Paeniglutamicibacter quisquiliarum]MBV1778281.1 DNA alkylation repair protein [Paeniglutamicibacter quisquiliarum]
MDVAAERAAVDLLTARLLPLVVDGKAAAAQAYMKTTQPFLGVPLPEVRRVARELARDAGAASAADRLALATGLWSNATHREHWYAAQEVCAAAPCRGRLEFLPLYERMVTEGAWWDIVDGCSRRYGELLRAHPETIAPMMRQWSRDANPWKRRQSMICQLHLGAGTDTALLDEALLANLGDPGFFIRKAMGWALRQYGKTDPGWVRAWVAGHRADMSPLSVREALRHLGEAT